MSLRIDTGIPINVAAPPEALFDPDSGATVLSFHSAHELPIPFITQKPYDRLCWAACTKMILSAFDKHVTLCEVASFLQNRNCCEGDLKACDDDCAVADVLKIFNHFHVDATRLSDPVSFESIQKQINERRMPIEVQIAWQPDGGHVLVIDGWAQRDQTRFVKINDPWYGDGEVRLSDLVENYSPGHGKWVGTWIGFRGE